MRRSEVVRALARVPTPEHPRAELEQVTTPPEAAADLLFAALRWDGLEGRSVTDLGSGTGRLAIGAALLGATRVVGVETDAELIAVARAAAHEAGARVEFVPGDVRDYAVPCDLVLMNPPFGAQRRHADRPFWDRALSLARRSVHAFSLADSRTFIARRAVAQGAQVLETKPIAWELVRTFPHHARRRVTLAVDRWAIRTQPLP